MDLDIVVTLGDVIDQNSSSVGHKAGRRYERRARGFFEHLDGTGVPVITIPGDRDPLETTRRLTQGLDNVVLAHGGVVTEADVPAGVDLGGVSLVGDGCETEDAGMVLPYTEFGPVDPRTTTNEDTIAYVADDVADQVEAAAGGYLAGNLSVDDVGDELGVHRSARTELAAYLDQLTGKYRVTKELLASARGNTIALSHRPPFNTSLDYYESFDTLDDRLHLGSLPLKMAIATERPILTLCGHVHESGTDVIETVNGRSLAFNPGRPGVAVVELDLDGGAVNVESPSF